MFIWKTTQRLEMRSNLFYVFLSFLCRSAFATNLHMILSDSDAGFFLKPESVGGQEDAAEGQQHSHVIVPVMHPLLLTSVRAEYGEFVASETVPRSLLRRALGSERLHPSTIIEDMEISAHVVMQTISTDRPLLQVLFHGNVLPAFRVDARRRLSETLEPGRNLSSGQGTTANYRTETKYCLTAYVEKDFNVLSSFCVLNGRTSVCLAEVGIPHWWWNADQTEYAQVFYSASVLDQNSNCLDIQNRNKSNSESSPEERNFISTVTLTLGQLTYEELKEDQNILVYIPQASFYPGSKFRVPVKLQAESDLQIFVMKVKARHGVRVIGAEARNSSEWKITLDLNHKLHGAMVTAFVADKKTAKKNDRITDIYEWIFEVNEEVSGDDRGRINLVVEYEMNVHQKEMYRSVENRIVARVEIQRDNVFTIVPVIKTSELVNTAVLTGKMLTYPLRIYSVTHTGRLNEVTPQATCHSGDEDALKVVESCSWVYLDGTEARGSSSVTVITKYGRHTKFLFFQVWMPEIPLEVSLSDPQLSQIKGWKVPNQPATGSSRKTRGADFGILTHPGLLLQEEGIRKEDLVASCDVRYQSSIVEVYTSFALADTPHNRFLVGRKAMFRVTDLVQSQMRLANTSVAVLDGNIIEGLQPGRTDVQVLSKSGVVIGASELIVATDKVGIEGLQVDIVAKLSLSIEVVPDMPRALIARVKKTSQLQYKYREAFLDISIKFDDGTVLPLQNIPHGDYHLDLDSLNNHVVAIGQSFNPDVPKVIALGRGKGELLKVSLMLNEACQRKKSRLLAFSHVHVEVDLSQPSTENERIQNDAAQISHEGNRRRTSIPKSGKDTLHVSLNQDNDQQKTRVGDGQGADGARGGARDGQPTVKEVQLKHIGDEHNLSSLEVGMYTLLGVFCVALVVFGINCGLFLTRYRHKKSQHDAKDPINCAPDWVWIGRDTLERNAINTACSQALMPDADFNGNHGGQTSSESSSGPLSANPGSNRNSSSASAVSNRNSFVSPYKGSECSVQVATSAAPPLPDCNANILDDNDTDGNHAKDTNERSSPQASVMSLKKAHHEHNAKKELMAQSSENHDTSSIDSSPHPAPIHGKMTREERFRQLEEAVASGSDVEWEYEALGVTYEELMEYFDNLKESTA